MADLLPLPASRDEIHHIQSERKKIEFERAKTAGWYKGKLDHIPTDKLEDPGVWGQIPIITKDILRTFNHSEFMDNFNVARATDIAE